MKLDLRSESAGLRAVTNQVEGSRTLCQFADGTTKGIDSPGEEHHSASFFCIGLEVHPVEQARSGCTVTRLEVKCECVPGHEAEHASERLLNFRFAPERDITDFHADSDVSAPARMNEGILLSAPHEPISAVNV